MEQWERDYFTQQITSGIILCEIKGKVYSCQNPPIEHKSFAQKVYKDIYEQCKEDGIWDENVLMSFLLESNQWSSAEEDKLNKLVEDVPKLKMRIYELYLKSTEKRAVKAALNDTRQLIDELYYKRHALDYLTCHGIASSAKHRYLIGASIYYKGKPYWKDFSGWRKPDYLLDAIINEVGKNRLAEVQLRELSRNDPWKTYWSAAKSSGRGVFNKASIDLTENQKNIILYAQMYDNIAESPECPSDDIIEDDDALDGWILTQRGKRQEDTNRNDIISGIKNEKIRNSEEIFVVVNSEEDAKKVYEANDIAGKVALTQRMNQVKREGVVREQDLNETKLRVMMQANSLGK
jgi:hypothetical protein